MAPYAAPSPPVATPVAATPFAPMAAVAALFTPVAAVADSPSPPEAAAPPPPVVAGPSIPVAVVVAAAPSTPVASAPIPAMASTLSAPKFPSSPAAVIKAPVAPKTPAPSLADAMAFSGPAPETINGRLAMLGFLAAAGAELATGSDVVDQFSSATVPILATFAVLAVASLVPIVKGANKSDMMVGPFKPEAELLNGRVAMVGLVALVITEVAKGSALF